MNVRNEINKHSSEDDKPVLLWLLSKYSMQSQWRFVARCTRQRHGPLSYQVNRVWTPTTEGKILCNHRHEMEGGDGMDKPKMFMMFSILKVMWSAGLRRLVEKAVEDPDESWDEKLLMVLDALLGYDGREVDHDEVMAEVDKRSRELALGDHIFKGDR